MAMTTKRRCVLNADLGQARVFLLREPETDASSSSSSLGKKDDLLSVHGDFDEGGRPLHPHEINDSGERALSCGCSRYDHARDSAGPSFCGFEVLLDARAVHDFEAPWPTIRDQVGTSGFAHDFIERSEAMGRIFQASAFEVEGADERKVALVFTDITERREQAPREREERLRTAVSAARLGVFFWDVEADRAHYENERMYEIFGRRSADGPISLAEFESGVIEPEDLPAFRQALVLAKVPDGCFNMVCRIRRLDDGQQRWIESSGRCELSPEGTARRLFGVVADITDRKVQEEALREANRQKDDYLAMLGHELRNPLAAIHTAGELVHRFTTEDPRLERAAAVLARQSNLMTRLVQGLLEVSRLARGKIALQREELDLRALVEAVLEDRAAEVEAHRLEARVDLPAEPLVAFVDRVRFSQVVDNLIANAIKFTDAPGTITVRLEEDGGDAVLRVRDTGIGIPPDKLTRIFEPFYQETQTMSAGRSGLGLGLALAKGLVDLHGGKLEAYSEGLGAGAELMLRLPLAWGPLSAVHGAKPSLTRTGRSVLIVDDNADCARMLLDLLELEGHRATAVGSAAEALKSLRYARPDVVLYDIGLPGVNGYALAREIREDPRLRDVPLVAVTGHGQPEDRRRSADAGFDAHLMKPVGAGELAELFDRIGPPSSTKGPASPG